MITTNFYKLLNKELEEILVKYPNDEDLHKHKNIEHNKGYAFLIWFLSFYGQKPHFKNYITEGNEDYACDIIFSNFDTQEQEIFYVVQSKWLNIGINDKGNLIKKSKSKDKPLQQYPQINQEEFKAVLTDFNNVLSGSLRQGSNEKFYEKYKSLITHLEHNGKARFIFFTAAEFDMLALQDSIKNFNREHAPNVELIVIDIHKIKKDYIEFKFKEIITENPLEYQYYPEDSEIVLEIERCKNGIEQAKEYLSTRDMLQFEGRTQAYIFLLKPKTIHQLFHKYKFNLFFKNVRNPLHKSNYNEKIVETLLRRPDTFWYFNNGVTAITKRIPDVGKSANTFTVKGLQVINGAQTVYSIYRAYEQANPEQREVMDTDARISFRLIRSSDEDFNLEITRYTNQQNEMQPRDFVANLAEQQRLQNESFNTNYWYEKRRDEFRDNESTKAAGVEVISNEEFALYYMAFYLQKPVNAILHEDKFFLKRAEDAEGLYEDIFNSKTNFKDMLSGYLVFNILAKRVPKIEVEEEDNDTSFYIPEVIKDFMMPHLALARIVLEKYLKLVYPNDTKTLNLNSYIHQAFEKEDKQRLLIIEKVGVFTLKYMYQYRKNHKKEEPVDNLRNLLTDSGYYELIKQSLEEKELTRQDIEGINIEDEQTSNEITRQLKND